VSTWLVVTGGDEAHQSDASCPLPPLDEEALQAWLDGQPEYRGRLDVWDGRLLTADIHRRREDGVLRSVSFSVTSRAGEGFDAEWRSLLRRLSTLAARMGGRLWDDDALRFVGTDRTQQ
jgi:hypothetical protein